MTRSRLMQIAEEHGLTLATERVTTGPVDGEAFREFEFTGGLPENCADMAKTVRKEWGVNRDFCVTRLSDIDYKAYVHVSSFYCGPQ